MNKQYIMDEIKRAAETNGGVPLGKSRFFRETGIKETDWKGKYWVRWSDAVKEVGLSAQKMAVAYDEEFLINKYIKLIRELGHIPISPELRMKSRNDKDFPSDSTYHSRFGNKRVIIKKIIEYCNQRTGNDDILNLCMPALVQTGVSEEENESSDNAVIGFVYLIKSGRFYKTGRSNAIGRREYELGIQLPEKSQTIHSIRTDDPVGIEGYWHRRFEVKRKNGEWFELSSEDVRAFKRRKFM